MPMDRPFSGEGSIANLLKKAEETAKRLEETLKAENLKREQEEAEAKYKQDTESLLTTYIASYKRTKSATNAPVSSTTTSPKNNHLEAYEYCLEKLHEERIKQIAPELKDANKKFIDQADLLRKKYTKQEEYKQKLQEWKDANPEIIAGRNQYISTISDMDKKDQKLVYNFIKEHYGEKSGVSATQLNTGNRDRSSTI